MTRPVVFVAGPIGDDAGRLRRAFAAMAVEADLIARGYAAIVPHHGVVVDALHPTPREDWLSVGLSLLRKADVVYRLPGHSPGADAETAEAERLGIPVVRSIDALEEWRRDCTVDPALTTWLADCGPPPELLSCPHGRKAFAYCPHCSPCMAIPTPSPKVNE